MTAAVTNLKKSLDTVKEAIVDYFPKNTKKHLTQRIQNLDDKVLEQNELSKTIKNDAEGYLTESQRHGKAGYSLTKLLARLKNNIRLIDRPHGQHSVILAEDIPKYLEYTGEKTEPGGIIAGSQQIYLTFPAESNFTEQDVSNYFNKYGPVQDVRISCQYKRMFGFVTFQYAETVRSILIKGNPHFVCGARVLVKPYREKSRPVDM